MRPQACGQYRADPGTLGTDSRDPYRVGPFRSRDLGWGRGGAGGGGEASEAILSSY